MLHLEGNDLRKNHFEESRDDATRRVQVVSSASSDQLQIPIRPIIRVRAKRFKEVLNGLIQDMWAKQMGQESSISKERSMIQAAMEGF